MPTERLIKDAAALLDMREELQGFIESLEKEENANQFAFAEMHVYLHEGRADGEVAEYDAEYRVPRDVMLIALNGALKAVSENIDRIGITP